MVDILFYITNFIIILYIYINIYMVLNICINCHKEFSKTSNYNRHIKTNTCLKTIQNKKYECDYCRSLFTTKSHTTRHLKTCKKFKLLNLNSNNNDNKMINNGNDNTNTNNSHNIDNSITNITNNNPINIELNINLCEFGKENYDFLNMDNVFGNDDGYVFLKLFEALHFNPDFQQNYNILLTDLNRKNIKIIKDKEWITQTKDDVLKKIVEKTFLYLNKIKDELNDDTKNKIEIEIKQFIFGELDSFYSEHRIKLNSRLSNIIFDNKIKVKEIYKLHKKKLEELEKLQKIYQKYNKLNNENKENKKSVIIESDTDTDTD